MAVTPGIDPQTWHGPGCTVILTSLDNDLTGRATVGEAQVTAVPSGAVGTPRTLVISVACSASRVQVDTGVGASTCQVTVALDRAPPSGQPLHWTTTGDAAAAWDAIRSLRRGALEASDGAGLAVAVDEDGLGSMPLEHSARDAAIDTPWFAWSNGPLACVMASGTDAGESFWDLAVVRRTGDASEWCVAYRALAYLGPGPMGRGVNEGTPEGRRFSLVALATASVARSDWDGGAKEVTASGAQIGATKDPTTPDKPTSPIRSDATTSLGNHLGSTPEVTGTWGILSSTWARPVINALDAIDGAIQRSAFGGARLPWALFWTGILIYVVTRLWGVSNYPIAFDGDEAGIVVLGRALLEGGFRDGLGIWFPIFFAYPNWNPDVGVYVHLAASSLFGVSVTVARTTSALLTVPAPIALAAALRWGFGSRGWWLAPYVLSALPIWFHLSRSAYDSATWVTFFACSVAAYFRYRFHDPKWALQFVAASLLTFYSNAVAHLFAAMLGAAVIAIDWRYHVANWRAWRTPLTLALAGMVPLATFLAKNPGYLAQRLSSTHPHWGDGTKSLAETATAQIRAAAIALNPMVWFVSENRGRFVDVTGYHNYYPGTMPLLPWWVGALVAGGVLVIWMPQFRGRRALLISLLAMSIAPTAISRFAPTRSLAAIVPIVLLALYWADGVLPRNRRIALLAGLAAATVSTSSAFLTLGQALTTQAHRVQDFGGYGIQWGSKEVFALVNQRLRSTPGARVMVTTDWTWGGHHFIKFFVDKHELAAGRVFLGSLETILKSREPWGPELWAILSPAQLDFLRERMRLGASEGAGSRVVDVSVTDTIDHPDGTPGFVMVRMREASNIASILAAERAAANRPTYSDMRVDGEVARVGTTAIDDGFVEPVLNNVPNALVRFAGPNPTVLDVSYPTTRPVSAIRMVLGAGMWKVTARLSGQGPGLAIDVSGTGEPEGPNSVVNLVVGKSPFQARRIVYEILQPNASEDDSTVHLYSVEVRP